MLVKIWNFVWMNCSDSKSISMKTICHDMQTIFTFTFNGSNIFASLLPLLIKVFLLVLFHNFVDVKVKKIYKNHTIKLETSKKL